MTSNSPLANQLGLTPAALEVFTRHAAAGRTPRLWIGKHEKAAFAELKRYGLLKTEEVSQNEIYIYFSARGQRLAKELGFEVDAY